jgi:DNA-binding response OmpR family regulator
MDTTHAADIVKAAKALRASLLTVLTRVDDLCDLVENSPHTDPRAIVPSINAGTPRLRLERATYTLYWEDRTCVLGHTKAFEVMERLCRRPNEYIQMDRLIDDLWSGRRTYSTVRSTVCRLKGKLRAGGMTDLAVLIDGNTRGHYRLRLPAR